MNILVTGSSGLIGSALMPALAASGHRAIPLVRAKAMLGELGVSWDPDQGVINLRGAGKLDAVVHLAGESIVGRWTVEKKRRIRDSRLNGTRLLAEAIAGLAAPPGVMVCASAIGYYGERGADILQEDSSPGANFLADVCREWEAAASPAAQRGIRVVSLRLGMVLSPSGGALGKMLLPFQLGLGGRLGSGEQYVSWIALEDVVRAIAHALMTETLRGPVNAVAPSPVTNAEFTDTLGRVLGRPTKLPLPAFAARLFFGEMADQLLLSSARVEPTKLLASGYWFRHPQLDGALRHLLGKAWQHTKAGEPPRGRGS